MRTSDKYSLISLLLLALASSLASFLVAIIASNNNKTLSVKNNNTRDYNYEHYCDSIYEVNPDYYLDVLVETDEFQNYIDEHGEWWNN